MQESVWALQEQGWVAQCHQLDPMFRCRGENRRAQGGSYPLLPLTSHPVGPNPSTSLHLHSLGQPWATHVSLPGILSP